MKPGVPTHDALVRIALSNNGELNPDTLMREVQQLAATDGQAATLTHDDIDLVVQKGGATLRSIAIAREIIDDVPTAVESTIAGLAPGAFTTHTLHTRYRVESAASYAEPRAKERFTNDVLLPRLLKLSAGYSSATNDESNGRERVEAFRLGVHWNLYALSYMEPAAIVGVLDALSPTSILRYVPTESWYCYRAVIRSGDDDLTRALKPVFYPPTTAAVLRAIIGGLYYSDADRACATAWLLVRDPRSEIDDRARADGLAAILSELDPPEIEALAKLVTNDARAELSGLLALIPPAKIKEDKQAAFAVLCEDLQK